MELPLNRIVSVRASIPTSLMDTLIEEGDLFRYLHRKGSPTPPTHLPSESKFILDLNDEPVKFAMGYAFENDNKHIKTVCVSITPTNLPRKIFGAVLGGWLLFSPAQHNRRVWTATKIGADPTTEDDHDWDYVARVALQLKEAEMQAKR